MKKALTIAGSDSGAGAGIQADLKTFSALSVYASTVITAVTAQNTLGVTGVQDIDPEIVRAQLNAVLSDIGTDAVKIGMLSSVGSIVNIAEALKQFNLPNIVLDPVITTTTGYILINNDALNAIIKELLPIADILTPNIAEAEILTGSKIKTVDDMKASAKILYKMGPKHVLIKGGHLTDKAIDVLFDGVEFSLFETEKINTTNTHGTGCTLSSAIAAHLAKGFDMKTSVQMAKDYITEAIRCSFSIGKGSGPVNHFYTFWKD